MLDYIFRLQLEKMKVTGNNVSFRCPICGDSKTKPNKRSAYILGIQTDKPYFYCHRRNCAVGDYNSFSDFLKTMEYSVWKEFIGEQFRKNLVSFQKTEETEVVQKEDQVVEYKSLENFYKFMQPVSLLHEKHVAVEYLKKRKISKTHWDKIFYLVGNPYATFQKIFESEKYNEEWRKRVCMEGIVVPFINENNSAIGFGMRMLNSDGYFRYLNLMNIDNANRFFFGEDKVNHNNPVLVLEGMLDKITFEKDIQVLSMISANLKLDYLKEKHKAPIVYVFDNEFLNNSIFKSVGKVIDSGNHVFLWDGYKRVKDINDLKTKYNFSDKDIISYIKKNTFSGMFAKLKLQERRQQQIEELIYRGD